MLRCVCRGAKASAEAVGKISGQEPGQSRFAVAELCMLSGSAPRQSSPVQAEWLRWPRNAAPRGHPRVAGLSEPQRAWSTVPAPAPCSTHAEVLRALQRAGDLAGLHCEATEATLLGQGSFGAVRFLRACTALPLQTYSALVPDPKFCQRPQH